MAGERTRIGNQVGRRESGKETRLAGERTRIGNQVGRGEPGWETRLAGERTRIGNQVGRGGNQDRKLGWQVRELG